MVHVVGHSEIGQGSKLVTWLQDAGLQVHDVARGREWSSFSGTVGKVGRALHTESHKYEVNGETHIANAPDPQVPAALAAMIAGFLGLNDFKTYSMMMQVKPEIYDLTPLYAEGIDGTGVSIAVIGRSDFAMTDIEAFRSSFNLPANDPQIVLLGQTRSTPQMREKRIWIWSGPARSVAAPTLFVWRP